MAGNHSKKASERRDSLKHHQTGSQQLQRKHPGRRDDRTNNAMPSALPPSAHHAPHNNFNSTNVAQFLNGRFASALAASQDPKLNSASRPEKYESQEKAWGSRGSLSSVFGQKGGTMASGADFFTEVVNRAK